jgi:CelD/BcsL family acetyltransferase involved in cellulose biosynthesis
VAPLSPNVFDLNPLADVPAAPDEPDAISAAAVAAALGQLGWRTERYFRFGNWYLEVAGRSFAEYFGGLSSQLRNTVTRKEKKLRQQPGLSITIAQSPAEAEVALAGYQQIYAASWKQPEPHPQFVPGLVRQLAQRGWLRLGLVQLGSEPVAAQIWACKHGVVSIFKLAYDEKFAQLSAGSVLTTHLMRHVIDVDRATVVDYLTGDDNYKRDWMSHRRERVGVRALSARSWRARGERLASSFAHAFRPLRQKLSELRHRMARRRPPTTPNA